MKDDIKQQLALEILAEKYSPNHKFGREKEIKYLFNQVPVIELDIEHLTGEEFIELVRAKSKNI